MLEILKWLLVILAFLAVTYVLLLYILQEKFVYVPIIPGMPREYPFVPSRFGLWYEDVKLVAEDGTKIHGWLVKPAGEPKPRGGLMRVVASVLLTCYISVWVLSSVSANSADISMLDRNGPTVMFLQENAGNIAHRMQNVLCMINKLHCNVFLLSYRGYGESEGLPSEVGIKQDAQAALDHLLHRKDIDTDALVVFGRSLGGAVASWLASVNPTAVKAVILENTFLSIPALAPALLPFIGFVIGHGSKPLNFIIKSTWRGIDFVQGVLQPVLYLSAGRDEMVPQWHMRELYKHSRSPRCEWVDFPEGRHMDMWTSPECQEQYWPTVYHFLRKNGCYQSNSS